MLENQEKVSLWIWELNAFIEATPLLQQVILLSWKFSVAFFFCTFVTNSNDEFFFSAFPSTCFFFDWGYYILFSILSPRTFFWTIILKWGIFPLRLVGTTAAAYWAFSQTFNIMIYFHDIDILLTRHNEWLEKESFRFGDFFDVFLIFIFSCPLTMALRNSIALKAM